MSKVKEILCSIESLPKEEFNHLRDWFYKRDRERWITRLKKIPPQGSWIFS